MNANDWCEAFGDLARQTMSSPELERYFSVPITKPRAQLILQQLSLYVRHRRDCWAFVSGNSPVLAVKQKILAHDDGLIEHRNVGWCEVGDHVETFALQAPYQRAIEHCGVDPAGFQGLADQHRIADHEQIDIVSLDVETDVLQAQNRVHPGGAADALDAEAFAAQLLGGF